MEQKPELYAPEKGFLQEEITVASYRNFFTAAEYTPFGKLKSDKKNL